MKKSPRILPGLFVLLLLSGACTRKPTYTDRTAAIIPKPLSLVKTNGVFALNDSTLLLADTGCEEPAAIARQLQSRLMTAAGLNPAVRTTTAVPAVNVIVFQINHPVVDSLGKEGYVLVVDDDHIEVSANEPCGLFYGMETILQLLPPDIYGLAKSDSVTRWSVPAVRIIDRPRYAWRGMHLDVSRHFFSKEFIKQYIDLIAMHKMNVFHWHLTDDNGWRPEIKKYPGLTETAAWRVDRENEPWTKREPQKEGEKATYGGYYTQDDIREIVAYARERYVTVIPEIEMPGHSREVFAAYPGLSCTGKRLTVPPGSYWPDEDIFCAGNEKTFRFIEDVLTEVISLFPSEYIHIGGDEADKSHWKKCPKCQKRIREEGLKDEQELQSYFIKRIESFLHAKGKKLIGWDEILEGGLAPDATVMSWRGMEGGILAARQGHDVVMTPTAYCYFDYYQADPAFQPEAIGGFTTLKKVYSFEPTPPELNEDEAAHILGAQGNMWTEYIATPAHAEYMALPRMTALAEVLWSPKTQRDWDDFLSRLQTQCKRFDKMKVNYCRGSFIPEIKTPT
jgi:hexosaminidase